LFRDNALAREGLVAAVGDRGEVVSGARVGHLLVEFGRSQQGDYLAALDAFALVNPNFFEIAGNLRIHRGFDVAVDLALQIERAPAWRGSDLAHQRALAGCDFRLALRSRALKPQAGSGFQYGYANH